MIKVSVVMATFNDESTIRESIESVLRQTFEHWELLVVDDGSSDTTASIVERIAAKDARVRLIQMSRNGGSGAARNEGIRVASGTYIAVLDADDLALEDRLSVQVDVMESNPDLVAVASQIAEFGPWGGPVVSAWSTEDSAVQRRQFEYKMPIPHPSTMFRAETIKSVGGYDENCRRAQDFALFLKLRDLRVRCLPEVLVHYRTDRPVSFKYVRRNQQYADLAMTRHRLSLMGHDEADIPTEPRWSAATEIRALKSWLVRSTRERLSHR
ncbi:glycosyl transferase family 2 [Williamsia limnetica]|uniref:Glycosyl transferase family 2 n=2 Tax=Williamsia limnetica TaxID=882452 RepID=A0A318RSF7_WILLI|nr:glycosyl transferase family 2 [Williamsia limnetica]